MAKIVGTKNSSQGILQSVSCRYCHIFGGRAYFFRGLPGRWPVKFSQVTAKSNTSKCMVILNYFAILWVAATSLWKDPCPTIRKCFKPNVKLLFHDIFFVGIKHLPWLFVFLLFSLIRMRYAIVYPHWFISFTFDDTVRHSIHQIINSK